MSDFLNNALNASDCTASAVAASLLHTQTGRRGKRRTAQVGCGSNVTKCVFTPSVSILFGFPRAAWFPQVSAIKVQSLWVSTHSSICTCGGRTRDNKDEWRQWSPRTLVCSREAWPPNAHGLEHTVSTRPFSSSNITLYNTHSDVF
jgi:hypothetical protein